MIRRDRVGIPAPRDLSALGKDGIDETTRLRQWVEGGRVGERPNFAAYKAAGVVAALEKLFIGKCAYCETRYGTVHPIDVEHWRPKAEVEIPGQEDPAPGYEWLAADWHNLLPSCIDCNRQRGQHVIELAQGQLVQGKRKMGKGNLFPLINEAQRARRPGDRLDLEKPLLINPCLEDPAAYFEYTDQAVIVPLAALDNGARQRALESIRIYALNRKGLVDARRERLLLLQAKFELIRSLISIVGNLQASPPIAPDPAVETSIEALTELIDREIQTLQDMSAFDQPYSLMARQHAAAFLGSIVPPGP